jgi:hypothetical protein
VLGFRGEQLTFDDQLTKMATAGIFEPASLKLAPAPLASPGDMSASIEDRATAYLAANCSPCHHAGAAYLGGVSWNASPGVADADRGLINQPNHNLPMAAEFGIPFGPLVKPGDPMGSILWNRVNATDQDLRMPPVGRTRVDPVGVAVIDAWIRSLSPP